MQDFPPNISKTLRDKRPRRTHLILMAKEIKNLLINLIHAHHLKQFASRYLRDNIVDIGCGTRPYKDLLSPYIKSHIGVDHEGTVHDKSNVDLFGTAYEIPAEDASFDSTLCTAALEHLEEPEKALRECCRISRSGGQLFMTLLGFRRKK